MTWLADVQSEASSGLGTLPLILHDFDYLITKPKLEEGDDFEKIVNTKTVFDTTSVGEPAMRNLQQGTILQLERKGFYKVDRPLQMNGDAMILVAIPDGKALKPKCFL